MAVLLSGSSVQQALRTGFSLDKTLPLLTMKWSDHFVPRRQAMSGRGLLVGLALLLPPAARAETWWSLRPLARAAVPGVEARSWCRTPIDAFILPALEARGLRPAPEADRRTLIRRLSFDLIG